MTNIVKQICPLLGGADCAGMVALNHRIINNRNYIIHSCQHSIQWIKPASSFRFQGFTVPIYVGVVQETFF